MPGAQGFTGGRGERGTVGFRGKKGEKGSKGDDSESVETLKKQIVSFLIMIFDYFSPIVFLFLAVPVNRGGEGVGGGCHSNGYAAFVRYPDSCHDHPKTFG